MSLPIAKPHLYHRVGHHHFKWVCWSARPYRVGSGPTPLHAYIEWLRTS